MSTTPIGRRGRCGLHNVAILAVPSGLSCRETDGGTVNAFVEAVCKLEFDGAPVAVEHMATGHRKETVAVTLSNSEAVVVQWSESSLATEARLLREIRSRTDVPVPRVRAAGDRDGRSYLVTERVPGRNLHERLPAMDERIQRETLRELGAHLGTLHRAFAFEDFGAVAVVDNELVVPTAREWQAFLRSVFEAGRDALPPGLADLSDRLTAAFERATAPTDPRAHLYPWDYRPGNALGDDGVAAVLDFEEPRAAPRALSLAKAEYCTIDWYGLEDHREAFLAGYESAFPLGDVDAEHRRLYRLVAIVRSASTASGSVTRPGFPMVDRDDAVAFHREALAAVA